MASSTFTDPSALESTPDASTLVTIVINENGEINYDAEALQSIIDSNQSSATVTLVRLGNDHLDSNRSTRPSETDDDQVQVTVGSQELSFVNQSNPILLLDQDQIMRLETVLKSEEAKDILGEVLEPSGVDAGAGILDILSSASSSLETGENLHDTSAAVLSENESDGGVSGRLRHTPQRRSQRQIEREMKEEAEKIKRENQERMRKERDAAKKKPAKSQQPSTDLTQQTKPPEDEERQDHEPAEPASPVTISLTPSKGATATKLTPARKASAAAKATSSLKVVPKKPPVGRGKRGKAVAAGEATAEGTSSEGLANTATKVDEVAEPKEVEEEAASDQIPPQMEVKVAQTGKGKKVETQQVESVVVEGPATARPKRQRKLPAHLQNSDFEYGFGSVLAIEPEEPKPVPVTKKRQVKKATAPQEASESEVKEEGEESLDKSLAEPETKAVMKEDEEAIEQIADDSNDDSEEEASDQEWDSEDDPERLWCICQKPHENKFMISCDGCKEWFHGKCVGITKKMGKEMEDAQTLWTCPTCKPKEIMKPQIEEEEDVEDLEDEIEELPDIEDEVDATDDKVEAKTPAKKRAIKNDNLPKKIRKKRASGVQRKRRESEREPEKKVKEKVCFQCEDNPPLVNSIYCSEICIVKQANIAKERFEHNRLKLASKGSKGDPKCSGDGGKSHILVMDSTTNTMLSGINAPTESTLEEWLKSHPTFYVVLPNEITTYKLNRHPKVSPDTKPRPQKTVSMEDKMAEYAAAKNSALIGLQAARKHLEEQSEHTPKREYVKRSISVAAMAEKEARKRQRKLSESATMRHKKEGEVMSPTTPSPKPKFDPKPIRANAQKGVREALKVRISKTTDVKMTDEELNKLSFEIEDHMYNLYNRDIGPKYKNKYRSLVFNIRDEKNNGLFRKIISGTIVPKDLVAMTAEEMASKELQEWRQAELRHDIEKIKSHELDMISLGSVFVMKSHKGEQVIEKDDIMDTSKATTEIKLPEDLMPKADENISKKIGKKTWEHGNHSFDSQCDVCTGKMTMTDFVKSQLEKRRKEKEERERKDRHKKSRHRSRSRERSGSKSKHHKERRRSRSTEKKRSRSRSRDKKRTRSRSKDKKRSRSRSKDKRSRSKDDRRSYKKSHHHHSSSSRHHSSDHHRHRSESKEQTEKPMKETRAKSPAKDKAEAPVQIELPKMMSEPLPALPISMSEEFYTPEPPPYVPVVLSVPEESNNPVEVLNDTSPSDIISLSDTETPETQKKEFEVSSTVSIRTPEAVVESNPVVWNGEINMPDVAKFSVSAHQVSGTTDYLTVDMKQSLKIVGRISPDQVWDYISKIKESLGKEILLIELRPSTNDERSSYDTFYNYLVARKRFGVIGLSGSRMVKDCYIVPLAADEELNAALKPLDGPGLDEIRTDILLALIVRTRRKRPGDAERDKQAAIASAAKLHLLPPSLPSEKSSRHISVDSGGYNPTAVDPADLEPYDPATAGADLDSISSEGDDEIYDPESAFIDQPPPTKRSKQILEGEKDADAFSSGDSTPKEEDQAKLSEELARLTQQIEATKKEINKTEAKSVDTGGKKPEAEVGPGFTDLPAGIATILFGGSEMSVTKPTKEIAEKQDKPEQSKKARDPRKRPAAIPPKTLSNSTLSKMSDDDLRAKAAQMLGELTDISGGPKQALVLGQPPPPPPGQFIPPSELARFMAPPPPPIGMYPGPSSSSSHPPPLMSQSLPPPDFTPRPWSEGNDRANEPWMRGFESRDSDRNRPDWKKHDRGHDRGHHQADRRRGGHDDRHRRDRDRDRDWERDWDDHRRDQRRNEPDRGQKSRPRENVKRRSPDRRSPDRRKPPHPSTQTRPNRDDDLDLEPISPPI